VAEQPLDSVVDRDDFAGIGVGDDHGVGDVVEDSGKRAASGR